MVEHPKPERADEDRVSIPPDPEDALKALLKVDPDAEPAKSDAAHEKPRKHV